MTYAIEAWISLKESIFDSLREEKGSLILVLVRDEVENENEEEVDEAVFDDAFHLQLLETHFPRSLQIVEART